MSIRLGCLTGLVVATLSIDPQNPFCGFVRERNTVTVELICVNGVIDSLPFAAFGTPCE